MYQTHHAALLIDALLAAARCVTAPAHTDRVRPLTARRRHCSGSARFSRSAHARSPRHQPRHRLLRWYAASTPACPRLATAPARTPRVSIGLLVTTHQHHAHSRRRVGSPPRASRPPPAAHDDGAAITAISCALIVPGIDPWCYSALRPLAPPGQLHPVRHVPAPSLVLAYAGSQHCAPLRRAPPSAHSTPPCRCP